MICSYAIQLDHRIFFQSWKWHLLASLFSSSEHQFEVFGTLLQTKVRVKWENWGLWEDPENLLPFSPWSMKGSGGMLGYCYPYISRGGGFRNWVLGKGVLFGFAILTWSASCLCKTSSFNRFNFKKKILRFICFKIKQTNKQKKQSILNLATSQRLNFTDPSIKAGFFSAILFHRRDRLFINRFFTLHLKVFCTQLCCSKQI